MAARQLPERLVRRFADPDLARYMTQIAAAMDDRQRRIGEHAAREQPLWVTQALGDVPAGPVARADWERKAGQLGAYREITGWDHPGEAIGPEPAATSPEARVAWHAAFAVIAHVEGIDVRYLTDGQLLTRCRAYETETWWAPKYVAEELRAARRQEQFSKVEATRHAHEAAAASRHGRADRVVPCPDCQGVPGKSCYECHGDGRLLMRACPLWGDLGWDYVNGVDDRQGMACRLNCGYRWSADDPGWRAQVLPSNAA